MRSYVSAGMAWFRDNPDSRDYGPATSGVRALLHPLKPVRRARRGQVDLREYFSETRNQPQLCTSVAHVCVGLLEYYERRAAGRAADYSTLFVHRVARNLLGTSGQSGTNLRTALKALVRFGTPPQHFWPDDVQPLDVEPSAFAYSLAEPFDGVHYLRLDGRNSTGAQTLELVKAFLAAGFPAAFGFGVPSSLTRGPDIPYRPTFDSVLGGQAAIAVGYDDQRIRATKGALLIRTSWGNQWGEDGYGWLPYDFVRKQLAVDFWTLVSASWTQSGEFRKPELP